MDFVCLAGYPTPEMEAALKPYERDINAAAIQKSIPACFLASIVWRESRGRNVLQYGMAPGPGCGVGLCQITYGVNWRDLTNPTLNGIPLLIPKNNLLVAAEWYIGPAISECQQAKEITPEAFELATGGQILYGAAAIYNGGWTVMQRAIDNRTDVAQYTTWSEDGGRYASDVFNKYVAFCAASHKVLKH